VALSRYKQGSETVSRCPPIKSQRTTQRRARADARRSLQQIIARRPRLHTPRVSTQATHKYSNNFEGREKKKEEGTDVETNS